MIPHKIKVHKIVMYAEVPSLHLQKKLLYALYNGIMVTHLINLLRMQVAEVNSNCSIIHKTEITKISFNCSSESSFGFGESIETIHIIWLIASQIR